MYGLEMRAREKTLSGVFFLKYSMALVCLI